MRGSSWRFVYCAGLLVGWLVGVHLRSLEPPRLKRNINETFSDGNYMPNKTWRVVTSSAYSRTERRRSNERVCATSSN